MRGRRACTCKQTSAILASCRFRWRCTRSFFVFKGRNNTNIGRLAHRVGFQGCVCGVRRVFGGGASMVAKVTVFYLDLRSTRYLTVQG